MRFKNLVLSIFFISLFFTACNATNQERKIEEANINKAVAEERKVDKTEVKNKKVIKYEKLNFYKNNRNNEIRVEFPYYKEEMRYNRDDKELKKLVKIYDENNNLVELNALYYTYKKIFIKGDFKKDEKYRLVINGVVLDNEISKISYDYKKDFIFKSQKLDLKSIHIFSVLQDLKSAHFVLDFNSGQIFTKDIRKYLKLADNIKFSYKVSGSRVYIYGDFKPNRSYSFSLKKGFNAGSSIVQDDLSLKVSFNDIKRSLKFKDYKSYVSSYTQAVDIETTNLNYVEVKIIKVNHENINYMNLFQRYNLTKEYRHTDYNYEKYGQVVEKYKKMLPNVKNRVITTQLDFRDKLERKDDGIYLIVIKNQEQYNIYSSKLVFKSDLGISTKVAKNQMFFSIRTLATNKPIKDAQISVFSETNKLLFKDKTNKFGILDKKYKNIINSKPRLVVVKKDEKTNFLYLDNPIASYDILNVYSNIEKEYDSLIFMERSLLRPNDSANILVSVKNKALKSLKNEIVYLQFVDPTQKELFTKKVQLNEVGIAEYKFTSYNDYKTGKYRVNLFLGKSKIGYKEFYIEAFIPEKIEVKIDSLKDDFLANDNIKFDLESKYLFGTPAKGLKYDMEIIANNSNFVSKKYKDYIFSNSLIEKMQAPIAVFNDTGVLNEKGFKSFDIKMKLNKTTNSMLKTNLIATVFDDGRAVRKFKEVNVYPFDTIVGLKKESKNSIGVNNPLKITPILLNPSTDTKSSDIQRLKIKVYKKYYHYYAGEELKEIDSYSINSDKDIVITPKESGTYYILAQTEQGQISVDTFYVSGWNYDPVNLKNKSSYKIDVKTNKDVYNIDETISIDIKTPILGNLLLTVEEDEILEYYQFDLSKNTANIEIKMPKSIKKGVYIKAQVVRNTNSSNDIFPFRVIGSKYIKKNNYDKKIDVQISNKKLYKSGEEVKIEVKGNIKNNSYAVISAVDIGILNIINEKATDAFAYFNKDSRDNISLYDLYSNLQGINKLRSQSASGGGEILAEVKREKHLSPDAINERVKPLSFWSKIIKLDENSEGIFTFKLPNFNGEILIQSLIISEDKIGSSSKKTVVKDDIVIKPTLPRFLIKGDEVTIPIRLLNTTEEVQNIDLLLQVTSNLLLKEDKKSLVVNPKESQIVEVKAKALEVGLSKFLIKSSTSKDSFTNETSLYIKDSFDYKLESINRVIKKSETINLEVIDKKIQALNTSVNVLVGVDNSPFAKLSKASKDLIKYPHGCVEQISSKLLAMLMSEKFIDKNDSKLLFEREKFIKEGIEKLISRQRSDGMFSYWEGGYINNYASFYTMYVLAILKEYGFEIPKKVLDKALTVHWSLFEKDSKNLDFLIPYAKKNSVNKIYDNKLYGKSLASYIALAAAMKKYNYIEEYKSLIQLAKKYFKSYDMNRQREYSYSFYSPIKDIAVTLYLYSEFINNDMNDEFANDLFRTVNSYISEDKLYSTQDKAFAMLALTSYYKNIDLSNKDINVTLKYEDKLKNIKDKYYENIVLKDNYTLSFTNSGSVVNYIVDINKPIDLAPTSKETATSKPLDIKAKIVNQNNEVIDYKAINLGDKLFMRVEVFSRKRVDNVAVNIQIPSGLEIINPRLYKADNIKLKNINYRPDYEDYRDDKLLFYLTTTSKPIVMYIPLVATTRGEFVYPASYIEAMYDSRLNSYSKATRKLHIK